MSHPHIDESILDGVVKEVEYRFRNAGMVDLPAGFGRRLKANLAQEQKAIERRNALLIAALWLTMAIALLLLLGWVLAPLFESPLNALAEGLTWVSSLGARVTTWLVVATSVLRFLPDFLPTSLAYGLAAAVLAAAVYGYSQLRAFALVRGVRL